MTEAQLYAEVGTSSSVGSVIDHLVDEITRAGVRVSKRSIVGGHDGDLRGHAIGWYHGYPHQVWQSAIHVHRTRIAGLQVDAAPALAEWSTSLRRLHAVYVPSRWVEWVLRPVLRDDCEVIIVPHGCDPPPAGWRSAKREPADGPPRLFMVSAGGPWYQHRRKGLDLAIDACRQIGARLVLRTSGDGARMAAGLDHVEVHGGYLPREDPVSLMRSCDLVVAPSRAEAFGMVALEALACGVPVVATEGTGMDDYLPEDDRCVRCPISGDLETLTTYGMPDGQVNTVEADVLATVIDSTLADRRHRRRLAEAGADEWAAEHSWTHAASPLVEWLLREDHGRRERPRTLAERPRGCCGGK